MDEMEPRINTGGYSQPAEPNPPEWGTSRKKVEPKWEGLIED